MGIKSKGIFMNALGGAVLAFGLYNVHSISCVTEGGALGLALLFENWFGISPALTNIVLSVICYCLGIAVFGRDFIVYSLVSAGSFSLVYAALENFPRVYPAIADMPLMAAVVGAAFVGTGVGLCVRYGGAPSADDALAMSLGSVMKVPIQRVYIVSDITVLLLSLTYIPAGRIVWSLLTVFLSGQLIGIISAKNGA